MVLYVPDSHGGGRNDVSLTTAVGVLLRAGKGSVMGKRQPLERRNKCDEPQNLRGTTECTDVRIYDLRRERPEIFRTSGRFKDRTFRKKFVQTRLETTRPDREVGFFNFGSALFTTTNTVVTKKDNAQC